MKKVNQEGGSYGFPFFMLYFFPAPPGVAHPKLEKTSKLANPSLLVWKEASEASQPQGRPASKLEKTSKLLILHPTN